jgi:hypothetical protein
MARFIVWVLAIALVLAAQRQLRQATLWLAEEVAYKQSHPMSYARFSTELLNAHR